jgi:hypothetical protein
VRSKLNITKRYKESNQQRGLLRPSLASGPATPECGKRACRAGALAKAG